MIIRSIARKIKNRGKITFTQMVQASVKFDYEKTGETKVQTTKKDSAKIGSSGNYAQIGSSGDSAQIGSSGKYSVICCAGNGSIAKGKVGSWITLSEWRWNDEEQAYIPICVKTEKIDGVKIKSDTFYKLQNGEFVEVTG